MTLGGGLQKNILKADARHVDDRQVVLLTLERGGHHYGELVQKYADFLFSLAMRLTHGDRFLAEDIAQETFMRSFKYLHRFDIKQNYKKWLIGIFYNCFKDAVKKQRYDGALDENMVASENSAADYSGFLDLLRPLDEDTKTVFTLKYLYEYTNAEIAEITGITERRLKENIRRGKEIINEQI
ncbi:hypothetical protein IMCC14465_02840 [alpha proteobacterium IMCC14465]|uniref:RNA polymerase sigma factor n=1 Tax=alpha proteobacterium IMCC14465 TaxID=1220535 RepID=J9A671_9PROT|nr:hypothetical protein IMCC14465_02840 [alpha proteobacterium IMCC14465]